MTGRNACAFFAAKFHTANIRNRRNRSSSLSAVIALLLLCLFASPNLRAQSQHESTQPNPAIPEAKVKSRAADLLKQMTLDEKIAQLAQLPGFPIPQFATNAEGLTAEQIIEKRGAGSMLWVSDPKQIDHFQHV